MLPEKGADLIRVAKALVGSHYLNGSYGAIPGEPNSGSKNRPNDPKLKGTPGFLTLIKSHDRLDPKFNVHDSDKNLAVGAAQMTIKTFCVCAGSWKTISGGRTANKVDWDLNNYLDTLRATGDPNLWKLFCQYYTPRRSFGPGQTGDLVWGQSCEGIRHFDCISFVNYCLMELKGGEYTFEILQWRDNPAMTGGKVFPLAGLGANFKLEDGDIIIKTVPHQHIAFVTKEGEIIQAADTDQGVVLSGKNSFDPRSPGNWTHLVRVS